MKKVVLEDTQTRTEKKLITTDTNLKHTISVSKELLRKEDVLLITLRINDSLKEFLNKFIVEETTLLEYYSCVVERHKILKVASEYITYSEEYMLFAKKLLSTGKISFKTTKLAAYDKLLTRCKSLNTLIKGLLSISEEHSTIEYNITQEINE